MLRRLTMVVACSLVVTLLVGHTPPASAHAVVPAEHAAVSANHDDGPPVPVEADDPTVFRHQVVAFLAGVAQESSADGTAAGPSLNDAIAAVNGMSDSEIQALQAGLGPLVTFWTLVDATAPKSEPAPRYGPAAYTPQETADLEALRARIIAYYDRLASISGYVEEVSPAYDESIAHYRATMEQMPLDDLELFQETLAPVPAWESILDVDPSQFFGGAGQPPLARMDGSQPIPDGISLNGTSWIHPECNWWVAGPVPYVIAAYLANTAQDVSDIFSNDFYIEFFGEGANAPNIPKLVTVAIWAGLAGAALLLKLDVDLFTNCHEWYHQTLLADHDVEMVERTDLISGTLTAHDHDVQRRMDRVETFHDEFRTTEIRLAIEKDLLRKGDKRISLFQIPQSECITTGEHQVCGMLEDARDIVYDTIQTGLGLGLDMTNALVSYNDGVNQQAQGYYKEAYTRYREAYVLAVRGQ